MDDSYYEALFVVVDKGNGWFVVCEDDWSLAVGPVYGRVAADALRAGLIEAWRASDVALAVVLDGLDGATPPIQVTGYDT